MKRNYSLFKLDSISGICKDAGQVLLGSMILQPILTNEASTITMLLGLGSTMAMWSFGLALAKK